MFKQRDSDERADQHLRERSATETTIGCSALAVSSRAQVSGHGSRYQRPSRHSGISLTTVGQTSPRKKHCLLFSYVYFLPFVENISKKFLMSTSLYNE